jgi:hypothetical protein
MKAMKLTTILLLSAAVIIGFIYPINIEKAFIPPPANDEFILGAMSNSSINFT